MNPEFTATHTHTHTHTQTDRQHGKRKKKGRHSNKWPLRRENVPIMFSRRRSKAENKFTHFVAINKNIKRPAISCCLLWTGFSNARHLLWLISNDAAAQTPCLFKVFPLLWCGAAVCHCCLTKSTRRNDRRLELLLEALRQITISSAA